MVVPNMPDFLEDIGIIGMIILLVVGLILVVIGAFSLNSNEPKPELLGVGIIISFVGVFILIRMFKKSSFRMKEIYFG